MPDPAEPAGSIVRLTGGTKESFAPVVSADGRYVAFNLASNHDGDVFVWDRSTGTTTLVSGGLIAAQPAISADGRFVAFLGQVTETDQLGVYLWDRTTGSATRLTPDDTWSWSPAISADGRYVTFVSAAPDLAVRDGEDVSDTNGVNDVFVWDATTGAITRVTNGNGASEWGTISADGRHVAFHSDATDLVPGDDNGRMDIFVWDATTGAITRVTDGDAFSFGPSISGTGRYITFESASTNIVRGETDEDGDIFMWDATTGETRVISDGLGPGSSDISADGRYVTYQAYESNLEPEEGNGFQDVFVWDAATEETRRITRGNEGSFSAAISADGGVITFLSKASDLVDGGSEPSRFRDVYVWTRDG